MPSRLIVSQVDYGNKPESSAMKFTGVDVTNVNYAAQLALAMTLETTALALTLGGVTKMEFVAVVQESDPGTVTNPFSQREMKWLVRYKDATTGNKFRLEMPCADLQFLDPANNDRALLTDTDVAAFVAAFEAYHITPDGNAAEVIEIEFVGRTI